MWNECKRNKEKPGIEINKYEMFKLNIVSMTKSTKSQAHTRKCSPVDESQQNGVENWKRKWEKLFGVEESIRKKVTTAIKRTVLTVNKSAF